MATPAALISYPCFKDLEKSNINFIESMPQQKKSRKSRSDKIEKLDDKNSLQKENYNIEYSSACDSESVTDSTSIIKKKDIEILPTLDEIEEVMITKKVHRFCYFKQFHCMYRTNSLTHKFLKNSGNIFTTKSRRYYRSR